MWDPQYKHPSLILHNHAVGVVQSKAVLGSVISLLPAKNLVPRYFEITIGANKGAVFIGWVRDDIAAKFDGSNLSRGIGGHEGTFGMDSYEGAIGTNNRWTGYYREKLKVGDCICSLYDPIKATISYYINGKSLGVAFFNVDKSHSYFPAVTLKYRATAITANFTKPNSFCPSDSVPLSGFTTEEKRAHKEKQLAHFQHNKDQVFVYRMPIEAWMHVCSFMTALDLVRILRSSRLFHAYNVDLIWKPLLRREFDIKLKASKQCPSPGIELSGCPNGQRVYQTRNNWSRGRHKVRTTKYYDHAAGAICSTAHLTAVAVDQSVHFYNRQTLEVAGAPLKISNDHEITCCAFSREETMVIGDSAGAFHLFEMTHPEQSSTPSIQFCAKTQVNAQGIECLSLQVEDQHLITSGWYSTFTTIKWRPEGTKDIVVWDLEDIRSPVLEFKEAHKKPLTFAKYDPKRRGFIVSGSYDNQIKFFDTTKGPQSTWTIDYREIPSAIAFEPRGNLFAIGGGNGNISIFDIRRVVDFYTDPLLSIRPHQGTITSLALEGNILISGGSDHQVVGWDIKENSKCFKISCNKGSCQLHSASFFKNSDHVFERANPILISMEVLDSSLAIGSSNKKVRWYDFSEAHQTSFDAQRQSYVQLLNLK